MAAAIEHIVFDIGKVLIHYDPNLPYARIIPDPEERRRFFETVCTHEWNLEQDRGRGWDDAEAALIAEHPRREAEIRAFRRHWSEMVPYEYEGSVALLDRLVDDGRDVTMLTNFASDTYREAAGRFAFLRRPRGVTVSGDIGVVKPDAEIYRRHAADFALTPAATLFIDDSPANVEGARKAGWQAVHFTGSQALKTDLERFGLLP